MANATTSTRMSAQARYNSLKTDRNPFERRGRQAASLTIPALFPEEGHSGSSDLPQPFQSIGARGVNHLAAKLLLALFPPNQPFFRLTMEEYVKDELASQAGGEGEAYAKSLAEFETALSRVEKTVLTRLEHTGFRTTANEALKQLIVAGNVLLEVLDDGRVRAHFLTNYVVKRDKAGSVIEIVVLETVSRMALPPEVEPLLEAQDPEEDKNDKSNEDTVDIYTRVSRKGKTWEVHQEVEEKTIPGSFGTYPIEKTPWLPLRFIKVDGEDYGRGMVEEQIGDLRSAEALQKAIVQFAAAASKILIGVKDGSLLDPDEIAEADSGTVFSGDMEEITAFQLDKFPDFQIAKAVQDDTRSRLEESFLLFSGMRRDAERVTAEEIRALIQELEQGLGGIYSVLAQEFQAPLVRRVIHQMTKAGDLPALPDDAISPEIITGVEALGRASDLGKIERFEAGIMEVYGPEAVSKYLRPEVILKLKATALGLDVDAILRSSQEIQQIEQKQAEQAALEKIGPEALRQGAAQQTTQGGQ